MLIAPNLEVSARDYLHTFPQKTVKKGEALFSAGAVREVEAPKGEIYFAAVQGSLLYDVTLALENGSWFGDCTCPLEGDCEHCYAAMRWLLDGIQSTSASKPPAIKLDRSASPKKSFPAFIEQKLGRKLQPGEKRVVTAIDDLFKNHADSAHIAEYLLAPILGGASAWQYAMHKVWPAPPRDAWEAWLYLAHFLRGRKKSAPPFLAQITPEAEVDGFVHEWQRREAIEHWSRQFGQFAARAEASRASVTDLRAVFAEIGVRLEASEDGGAAFELVKKTHYAQMEREFVSGQLQLTAPAALLWSAFRTGQAKDGVLRYDTPDSATALNELLRNPLLAERLLGVRRDPLRRAEERLQWKIEPASAETEDYRFTLVLPDGTPPPPAYQTATQPPPFLACPDIRSTIAS